MKVVINTAPLVFLSKINRLTILRKFGRIFVPKGVISEIEYKQDDASAAVIKILDDWLKIKKVKDKDLLNVLTNIRTSCMGKEERFHKKF